MVMASKMMVMMALSMMPIMVMRTFPRRSGDDGPPPNGGDESTDWGAGDEGDDDDPELPLRGPKVFDHETSNCLAGHACRGRPMRMRRCLDADSGAIAGPAGRPTSEARATALE